MTPTCFYIIILFLYYIRLNKEAVVEKWLNYVGKLKEDRNYCVFLYLTNVLHNDHVNHIFRKKNSEH